MVKQKTIQNEISLIGVGLHTGKVVKMTFKPAPVNNGYTFVRVDLEGCPGGVRHPLAGQRRLPHQLRAALQGRVHQQRAAALHQQPGL